MLSVPPKQRITKEMILESAYKVFCEHGMENVNARSVARELNCSTQPIFSYYKGMGELKECLEEQASECFRNELNDAFQAEATETAIYEAYIRFAANEPQLFRHLFIETKLGAGILDENPDVSERVKEFVKEKCGLDQENTDIFCRTLAVYAHGLAARIAMKETDMTPAEAADHLNALKDRELRALH